MLARTVQLLSQLLKACFGKKQCLGRPLQRSDTGLLQSEASNRALLAALPDLVMRVSRDGIYLDFITTNAFKVIGEMEDFLGTRVEDSLPPHLAQIRMDAIHRALSTGLIQVYEQDIEVDGQIQTEEVRVVACQEDEALLVVRDITDRKRAQRTLEHLNEDLENRVRQRTLALEASERKFRHLFENSQVGIFRTQIDDALIVEANQRLIDLLGFQLLEEVVGKKRTTDFYSIQDRQSLLAQLERRGVVDNFEFQFKRQDGECRWALVSARVNQTENYIEGIFTDITERKQAEQERQLAEEALRQLNTELEDRVEQRTLELKIAKEAADAANQAKSEFLASMSHELRTPLNGILGFTQILQRDPALTPKQKDALKTIHHCSSHLLTLIGDILDLAKIEARKLELQPANLKLKSLLLELVEIFHLKAAQKDILFSYESCDTLPLVVYSDEKCLRQVLMNLLSNAIKFTDYGSVTFRVTILDQVPGSEFLTTPEPIVRLRFSIEDTGFGIAPEHRLKIFQPFEQVGRSPRHAEGTGLGLAISQEIVQLMGSQIQLESLLGEGSIFWFDVVFPVVVDYPLSPPIRSESAIVGYQGTRRKVLIVDDRWENREVFLNVLAPLGFELQEAKDGQEGIEQTIAWQPDLIITDLQMPGMDGFAMTQQLRQMPAFQAIPILACSANVSAVARSKALASGCTTFLLRPVELQPLFAQLQSCLALDWIYRTTELPPQKGQKPPADWLVPPDTELLELKQSIFYLDQKAVFQALDVLEQGGPEFIAFIEKVRDLAYDFDFEAILNLIVGKTRQT